MPTEYRWDIVKITDIVVDERGRKDYGDLTPIMESAKGFMGQLQNLVLVDIGEGKYRMVAGDRRRLSFAAIGMQDVFAKIYKGLTTDEEGEIELTENIARLDMTYQEKVALTKKIHSKLVEVHGEKKSRHDDKGWSMRMTANKLGVDVGTVSRDIRLADFMELVPELKKCKTQREAENLVAKIEEEAILQELATRMKDEPVNDRIKGIIDGYRIGDFFELISEIPDNSIDFIDFDPPYAIAYEEQVVGNAATQEGIAEYARRNYHDINPVDFPLFLESALSECFRVLKDTGWIITWFGLDPWYVLVSSVLKEHNLKFKPLPAIWNKNVNCSDAKASNAPDLYLGRHYEPFFYGTKKNGIIRRRARSDVFNYAVDPPQSRIHPNQKPVELMKDILETFTVPSSSVLVPFAGSGSTLLAAAQVGMTAVGFDKVVEFKNAFIQKVVRSLDNG